MVSIFIYRQIYSTPLRHILTYMIILIILWKLLDNQVQKKSNKLFWWKLLNILTVVGILIVIGIATLSSRNGSGTELILTPFQSFQEAKIQPERYRSMLMNVFLFFPLGLSMPFALPKKWKLNVFCTILFALMLSVGIEFAQYHYQLGRAEIDDVICNTLGTVIGSSAYLMTKSNFERKKR